MPTYKLPVDKYDECTGELMLLAGKQSLIPEELSS